MKLLYDYQLKAVEQMTNGCVLCGGVGSGKSRTSLAYYCKTNGSDIYSNNPIKMDKPLDLYIITTARKRDTLEWDAELPVFRMSSNPKFNNYKQKIVIDSWNNIKKYESIKDSFFIFDEQRVIGSGTWVKAFLKITRNNKWVLLSATPGDSWSDYIPVFIANGFYKNRTQFNSEHVVYSRFSKFPKIDKYINIKRLIRLRDNILIDMDFDRPTISNHLDIFVDFDNKMYRKIMKNRWEPYKNEPIVNAGVLCYTLRKLVNSDPSRLNEVINIYKKHKRVIIFYNFDYELELLKTLNKLGDPNTFELSEWNGHKHQPIPETKEWIYLVQYTAGAEGWNCIRTNSIIFYSQNYSYKVMLQAAGRIDRLNTPFKDLYYYHLKSKSKIDLDISRSLSNKKNFNEGKYISLFK